MKCKFCNGEATVFYTQIIDGKSNKMNLCETCAEEQGVTSLEKFQMTKVFMDEDAMADHEAVTSGTVSECSHCGFTLNDLRRIGRLGCSYCYDVFGFEIEPSLKKMHRGTEHKGKAPLGMIAEMKQKRKLAGLRADLEKAVAEEDYEKAATLRDQLGEISNKTGRVIE